ncbi:hypothetical protein JSE7799_02785 [Jannaschia seosinensis]|uniref:Uncharacterized protein n=1 Tax=Jannaschia seosinensis TaxID=313367 RepID=A0A0M7BFG6_9RHOB|nr:hypothetical protein JSE7799_02785 [Jannaschia seosinensis]
MRQRHEHLSAAPLALPHVVLHDRIAAGETMLIAEPFEQPLRRVPLLAMDLAIAIQPAVDDPGEPVQLRPLHGRRSPVSWRNRERQHLLNAVARNPEVMRRRPLAHALRTGQSHLTIQVHGENPPALPAAREGKGGRLLRRPQQAHPAATVADFCTAVLRRVDVCRLNALQREQRRKADRKPGKVRTMRHTETQTGAERRPFKPTS